MPYDVKSMSAGEFISHEEILATIEWAKENKNNQALIEQVMTKARRKKGLDHREASLLLTGGDEDKLFDLAREIRDEFYGRRVVLFAPLYLSNYCVNGCVYCPYNASNEVTCRKKLSQDEIRRQVIALQDMGHKRLAIEAGEHPTHSPIEYILESIKTIYGVQHKNGAIRRVNVNVAAATVAEYEKLRDANIGTYILFQETYHRAAYEKLHPTGPKSNYDWHTEAMDRAMQAGLEDVGIGALFGLADYKYELAALLMHAEHLEAVYGVGPHTISLPRIREAEGIDTERFGGIDNKTFAKIVAVTRISAPYTGIIISTREDEPCRKMALDVGATQISGGSSTSVGGYNSSEERSSTEQFEISDKRSLGQVVDWLIDIGYIPSFCTACYREGRVGERFMTLCKSGNIQNCCHPNALMTLQEYLIDYAGENARIAGEKLINAELGNIPSDKMRDIVAQRLEKIKSGSRDFRV